MKALTISGDPALETGVLQMLYDSEINFELSCFWNGGFIWKLGDSANGYPAGGHADSVSEAIARLRDAALTHFPQSDFAKTVPAGQKGQSD